MNRILRITLNILIVIAAIVLAGCIINMVFSIKYANREVEDPAETYAGVFEYMLEHRAYGEIIDDYYVRRMKSLEAPAGFEDLYLVGEYAHTAFMSRVYDEKGDPGKVSLCNENIERLRRELGSYEYTADQVDEMIRKAP